MKKDLEFDVVVIGGGHAGCEASAAAARLGLKSMTIAVSGKNLWMSTDYSGIDPELNAISRGNGGIGDFQQSIDAFGVPIPKIWNLSIKVGL